VEIPKDTRVSIRIRYNGYVHEAVALLGEEKQSSSVHIFFDQLPKGFHDEHGAHQIDYVFGTRCIIPDVSGLHGWVTKEDVDLDYFAGKKRTVE
jgi:hypothetical protein